MKYPFNKKNIPYIVVLFFFSVASAIFLGSFYSKSYIHSDASQYLSVAENIVQGAGIKTNIIYYQQHHDQSTIPATQTVFPPGLPALIATVHLLTGLSLSVSLYAICVIFFLAVPVQLFFLFTNTGVNKVYGILIVSTCYMFSYFILQTINFASELLFTYITLLSTVYIANIESFEKRISARYLIVIGLLAGASMTVRYAGIFYIMSLMIYFTYKYFIYRNSSSFKNLLILMSAAAVIPALLFIRNYYYTGSLTGGPSVTEGSTIMETLYAIRWQFSMLFGYFINGVDIGIAEISLFVVLFLIFSLCVIDIKKFPILLKSIIGLFSEVAKFSLVYIALSLSILIYFSITKSDGYFNARYIMVLFPFFLIIFSEIVRVYMESHTKNYIRNGVVIFCIFITFLSGQYELYKYHIAERMSENSTGSLIYPIDNIMINDMSLTRYLEESITETNPLLTNKAQRLWVHLRIPLVSFTPNLFTRTIWDNIKAKEMIEKYNIKYILLYKKYFNSQSKAFDNQLFYKNVINSDFPDWINVIYNSDEILFMEII